jgi:hypothetical protein
VKNHHRIALFQSTVHKIREWLLWQPFPLTLMKRFFTLFAFILVLIVSEYFLLNEVLSHQRFYIIFLNLAAFIGATLVLMRLFRKTQEQTKG